jgi:hypothetical protein
MITPELRSKIDALWLDFATNSLTNPLEGIEQITYLKSVSNQLCP